MADQLTKDQILARGDRAKRLLDDAAMKDALAAVEADITGRMLKTALGRPEERETLYAEYCGLRRVVQRLQTWAGEAAQIASEN